jgi:hypothetical protein
VDALRSAVEELYTYPLNIEGSYADGYLGSADKNALSKPKGV